MSHATSSPLHLVDLIRPAAMDHLQHVLELLADDGPLDGKTIHEIRRSVKRIRAILQLVRTDWKSRFDEWDKVLQAVNRTLSGARDLEVCRQTADDLSTDASSSQRTVLGRLSAELSDHHAAVLNDHSADLRPELSAQVETVRTGFSQWRPSETGFALVRPAVRRMAKQARRIIRRLCGEIRSDELHALRKVVKWRLYWLETLEPVWPRGFGAEWKLVDSLADRLGKHHDLAVLTERLHDSEVAGDESLDRPVKRVLRQMKRRQRQLERHALRLARRLFVERPKAMEKRWSGLVEIWQGSSAAKRRDDAEAAEDERLRMLQGESA